METKMDYFHKNHKQIKNKFNNPYSSFQKIEKNYYGNLSSKIKIRKAIASLSKENSKEFREALNKYSFDLEVFIPRTMSINKNEYKNKNFLLNSLVSFEQKSQERKKLALSLKKENNRFSTEYNIIKNQNEEHQKNYLKDLETFYHKIGYNRNSIEYNNEDNIFNPSSVLDHDFGVSIKEDAYKYSNIDLRTDYDKDQDLLQKWMKGIEEVKESKIRSRKVDDGEEAYKKRLENEEIIEKEKEREKKGKEMHKVVEKLKKNLVEENRIKNMSKEEYSEFNKKLKEDIETTKKLLEEVNEASRNSRNNTNNYNKKKKTIYFTPNKLNLKMNLNLNININRSNRVGKTYKIIHPTKDKNYNEKIVFSMDKKSDLKKNRYTDKNLFFSSSEKNNSKTISLPKLSLMIDCDKSDNREKEYKDHYKTYKDRDNNNKTESKSEIQSTKKQKIKELDYLYNLVYNNKSNFFEEFPSKGVENYFKKYTNKRIPMVNFKKGSNIHGLFEDLQQAVSKNNFYKIAESSNNVKRELIDDSKINAYNKYKYRYMHKRFDVDKIQEMDSKIPDLHYFLAENLLVNRTKKNNRRKYI